ncbi:class I tRNA ligase family protein [Candidatus Vidania fulgoroideorum]
MINIFNINYNMKANLLQLEKKITNFWNTVEVYNQILNKKRKKIILHDGPPYANGQVHLGHCLNKILKDTIIKKINLLNFKTSYYPGWDCHGIPIELEVKKTITTKIKNLHFRRYAFKQINKQLFIFKQLGMLYDWQKYYKTMSFKIEYKTVNFFKKILKKKMIFLKKNLSSWCSRCKTTLSIYETTKKLKVKKFYLFLYKRLLLFKDNNKAIKKIILKHNNYFYLTKHKKKHYFILKSQKKLFLNIRLLKKISINYYKTKFKKIIIKNFNYIITKPHIVFKKNFINKTKNITACWRHKQEILKRKKQQWFLKINFKSKIINKVKKKINFFPKRGKNEFIKYIKSKPDWNISRKKKWGTVIPLVLNKKNKKIYFFKKAFKFLKKYGVDFWGKIKFKKKLLKLNYTLDVWFDSGVTHFTVVKNSIPKICVEGKDQYRGWFNSSLITKYILYKNIFCKNIVTHGFVLNKFGEKMSKSLNNYTQAPLIIKKYGSELLRFFFISVNYFKDIKFSEEKMNNITNVYKKLRFIIRFMLSNTIDFTKKKKKISLEEIDKYFLNMFYKKIKKCVLYDLKFEYFNSFKIIKDFCFNELNLYFEINKERLYILNKNSHKRLSCQKTIKFLLKNILIYFSPYLSFTCEEAWNRKQSIFLSKYKKFKQLKVKIKSIFWKRLFVIRGQLFIFFEKHQIKTNNILLIIKKEKALKKIPKYYLKKILKVTKIKIKKIKNKFKIFFLNYLKCSLCWNYFKNIYNGFCNYCNEKKNIKKKN